MAPSQLPGPLRKAGGQAGDVPYRPLRCESFLQKSTKQEEQASFTADLTWRTSLKAPSYAHIEAFLAEGPAPGRALKPATSQSATSRTGVMVHSVECLPCKHEGLGSIPSTHLNVGVVVCTCNPSPGEADRNILRACWLARLDPVSKMQDTE